MGNRIFNRIQLNVSKPGFSLVVDMELPSKGISVLYGPSGSGKTTVLRCIAGLERSPQALVQVGGQIWQDESAGVFLPTYRRSLGYVFQEASLFAHLDVAGNLEFARRRATPRMDGSPLLTPEFAIQTLGLSKLLHRRTTDLSGGERQRVAIARALATNPQILLLDEPLASLDEARRREVLPWLEQLGSELKIPMVYVSHATEEVTRLADTLVVLEQGRVMALGPVDTVLSQVEPVIRLGGETASLVTGRVISHDPQWHLSEIAFDGGTFWVPDAELQTGQWVRLRVLARDVSIATQAPSGSSIQNTVACTVAQILPDQQPAQALVRLDVSGTALWARLTRRAVQQLQLQPGMHVWAQVKAMALTQ
ncbi:ModC ABC-type molybdate transport system, ATPase component [Comamonadaceae bacterium]